MLEFDDEDDSDWETNSDVLVTATVLEGEVSLIRLRSQRRPRDTTANAQSVQLADLKRYLHKSVEELQRLHAQSLYFDPNLPRVMGWTEELNESDHKASSFAFRLLLY